MIDRIKPYNKSLVPLVLLLLAILGNALGVDTGIDIEAQVTLLVASIAVFAVPNKPADGDEE